VLVILLLCKSNLFLFLMPFGNVRRGCRASVGSNVLYFARKGFTKTHSPQLTRWLHHLRPFFRCLLLDVPWFCSNLQVPMVPLLTAIFFLSVAAFTIHPSFLGVASTNTRVQTIPAGAVCFPPCLIGRRLRFDPTLGCAFSILQPLNASGLPLPLASPVVSYCGYPGDHCNVPVPFRSVQVGGFFRPYNPYTRGCSLARPSGAPPSSFTA